MSKNLKIFSKWFFGLLFVVAGLMHFIAPRVYLPLMPPYIPFHLSMIYLSGALEIILGILLLIPKYSKFAAWGLIALLIAVFPANVHMALHKEIYPQIPEIARWIRLPFQFVFIGWAFIFTKD